MASRALPETSGIDPQNLPTLIRRVVDRYIRAFAPQRIVLFGSYAKGTNQQSSDIDLLVVADLEEDSPFHLRRARQLATDCFPPVDVVFATTEEVASAATAKSPFLLSILEKGIVVYQRPGPGSVAWRPTNHESRLKPTGGPTGQRVITGWV